MITAKRSQNLLVILLIIFSVFLNIQAATLNQNGYTLNIAISNQVSRIPGNQRASFLQNIRVSRNSQS